MADLPDATLVLPSHGRPFTGAATRVAQLKTHHAERLAELLQACAQTEHCAHELLLLIFKRPLDGHQTTFAMGEAVAHLNLLWLDGKLQRLGHDLAHGFPETGTVVHLAQMGQFMHHHVIDLADRQMNQAPVEPDVPIGAGAAP
eukprot:gene16269-22045_t